MSESSRRELERLRARIRELESIVEEQAARLDALARTEAEFRAILDHAPVKFALKDADGRYVYVNRRAEIDNGYLLEEIRGKLPHEVHYDELARKIRAHDLRVLTTGQAPVGAAIDSRALGRPRAIRWRVGHGRRSGRSRSDPR